jgi:hypothetical protein
MVGYYGGAIDLGNTFRTNVTLNNNIFRDNHAFKSGGAIYIKTLYESNMYINNNVFENNVAKSAGGDLNIHHPYQSVYEIELSFTNNTFINSYALVDLITIDIKCEAIISFTSCRFQHTG